VDLNQKRELSNGVFNQSHGSFELVLGPAILAMIGLWVDKRLEVVPLFTLVLAFAGLVGATAKLYFGYRHAMDHARTARPEAGLP
jgi:F0F1-type ATP synthase assembly protein I